MIRIYILLLTCVWLVPVAESATFHVSPSGSGTPPYSSPATAAKSIQPAVDLAVNTGDMVLIHDGTYLLEQSISIDEAIRIASVNGPESVTVDGDGQYTCFVLADVACEISGLTIINGYNTGDGGGVSCAGAAPLVTNCVVMDCAADSGGGISGGRICFSTIESNSAGYAGGGLYESIVWNSIVRDNVATDYSGGLEAGSATNCLFDGNSCGDLGGGASFSVLVNCTVVDNVATNGGGGTDVCDIYNSIVISNYTESADKDISSPGDLYNCCSPDAPDGVDGNISAAPLFVDEDNADYRLQEGSPCRDAGDNSYILQSVDLDGNNRISGGLVDMGTYELQLGAVDLDGDGMEDWWEIRYLGGTNAQPNAHGDADEQDNLSEFIAGTDPTNSQSFFAITNWAAESAVLKWPSVQGRQYRVLWTENLTNGFDYIDPSVIDYPQNSYTDTLHSAGPCGFYRVEVSLP